MYATTRKYKYLALLLAVLLAIPMSTGLAFAALGDMPEMPSVSYGYEMKDAKAGYLLFDWNEKGEASTTAPLDYGEFSQLLTVNDFDLNTDHLQAGLSLEDVYRVSDTVVALTFTYEGDGYLFEHPLEQIGELDLTMKSSAISDYSGADIPIPIIAEVKVEGKIPFGPRLYREIAAAEETGSGGMADQYAATIDRAPDVLDSPYYQIPDFYHLKSDDHLTILSQFNTIQQALGNTCGLTSALMLVDWYGLREGTMENGEEFLLNELDLQKLRDGSLQDTSRDWGGATTQQELVNVFTGLNSEYDQAWAYTSLYDWQTNSDGSYVYDEYGSPVIVFDYLGKPVEVALFDFAWFLERGIPVIVGSQTWGGHYQVVVGYDDMGTPEDTKDDVLILADPYDTTDHKQDGFVIKPYERFIWDWSVAFDPDFDHYVFLAAWPASGPTGSGEGSYSLSLDNKNLGNFTDNDGHLLAERNTAYYQNLAAQLDQWRTEDGGMYNAEAGSYGWGAIAYGKDGLGGPLSDGEFIGGVYRAGDVENSPYYKMINPYTLKNGDMKNLRILENFQTIQQATEFTCGNASMLMAMNYFQDVKPLTEIDLANLRSKSDQLPGTNVQEMMNVIDGINREQMTGVKWNYVTTADVGTAADPLLYRGKEIPLDYESILPAAIDAGLPVMVMWHEWDGHWQVVIGYDDMGTADYTQDDVLILADPYDTTDHNQDGYVIESYERLLYDPDGWWNRYDPDYPTAAFVIMYPAELLVDSPAKNSNYSSGASFTLSGSSLSDTRPDKLTAELKNSAGDLLRTYEVEMKEDGSFQSSLQFPSVNSNTEVSLAVSDGQNKVVVPLTLTYSSTGGGSSRSGGSKTTPVPKVETPEPTKEVTATAKFTDTTNHWAAESIDFVVNKGLFQGVTSNTFEPNKPMTRGMLVTVLGRLSNISPSPRTTAFLDVDTNQYYSSYIAWATENKIVTGYSPQSFGPNDPLTREQVATIISRYAQFSGHSLPEGSSNFTDQNQISSWAVTAVGQMNAAGIIQGRADQRFDGSGSATRAEIATILQRYVSQYPN